jgi:tetratricopeptide (TPR) repeat protein
VKDHARSPRVAELEVLTNFYSGKYEAAAKGVAELRRDPRTPIDLGNLADVIVATHETTKGYETVRYEDFEVRYSPGEDEILVPYAIDTLKAAAEAMEAELGVKMVSPVRLEIYPDAESLAEVSPLSVEAIRTTGTIALCKWGRLMIASPRALMHGYPWLDTIAHEYVHLILTKATLDRAPVWLQEGTAKLLETRWREAKTTLRQDTASARLLQHAATANELLDFERLHPSIALLPSQKAAALAFAQVSSFMDMFYQGYGHDGLQDVLDGIASGEDARRALARVAKMPWNALEEQWKASLDASPPGPPARLMPRYLRDETTEQDEVADVEADRARKFVRLGDMLWARARPAAASIEYGKAHKAAPTDPVVASRYARSALAAGLPKQAIAPLMLTLKRYPNHEPALSSLATAMFRTSNLDIALDAANRAIAQNPFDPQPHCILSKLRVPQADHEATLCERLGGMRE